MMVNQKKKVIEKALQKEITNLKEEKTSKQLITTFYRKSRNFKALSAWFLGTAVT